MATTYAIVAADESTEISSSVEIKKMLESNDENLKIETMRKILTTMMNGDSMPDLLMHVIRFVMPSKNKVLKKLLYFYWEICPKLNPDGKLKQEMILVCNALRNDLQHPNEFIRGIALRFVGKLREPELLEPLLPTARACLEHRHEYVRKNAIFAIYSVYHHAQNLLPDAPDLIYNLILEENNSTCKRNAFVALCGIAPERATAWLQANIEAVTMMNEEIQLAVIEFIHRDASKNSAYKAQYLRLMFELLEVSSNTVVYEAANSLTALTSNPVVIKAAALKLIHIITKESDNNVKIIVLDRIEHLRKVHDKVVDDLIMEVLRVLSSPDIDVRKKALEISLEMVSSATVNEVILLLKKELAKSMEQDYEKNNEYRQLIIHAIHTCAIRYSQVAADVVHILMDYMGEFNSAAAVDIVQFIKEVVERFPDLRASIIERLMSTLTDVRSGKVYRGALWIVGEYSVEEQDIREAWRRIRASLGEIPIVASEQRNLEKMAEGEDAQANGDGEQRYYESYTRRVLADGTYATESAITTNGRSEKTHDSKFASRPPLRALILDGDYYLASVLSSTLTKLVMRYSEISRDLSRINALKAEAMLIMTSILRVGQTEFAKTKIDEDSADRILSCLRSLAELGERAEMKDVFLKETKKAYTVMLSAEERRRAAEEAIEREKNAVQPDDLILIRQFALKNAADDASAADLDIISLDGTKNGSSASQLSRIIQLTGFSDPIYAEAFVNVHQFDIVLDVLLVNQSASTLQNLTVEFATLGDLKIVERPLSQNLAPHSFHKVQATIKVSSTDTGVIFGNCIWDSAAATENNIVILSDIHVDIMDYIQPATCTETQFRNMWTEFEWENKVNISSKISSLREFLDHLMKSTNMSCLTPEASLRGDCGFLSANLYARSVFGEDVLANLSVEKDGGLISGHVRIRSKAQGMALSMGDKVSNAQRTTSIK
ncbi:Coatomer subunit beta [Neolecta irregularis DAH-3]|uniref:Coatomer subunit beta n=1 Tax=Neolecta irregularis (strain DAH-3) TaxID=1198029 RepID=A0A1U7LPY9_NEOID|nr:Coatomer subunit beta [Neolecta irregularis DAH-3]|eukprot:OLL24612.1 Coatomer subunit beta [Neolecta irregularis DAH-3]